MTQSFKPEALRRGPSQARAEATGSAESRRIEPLRCEAAGRVGPVDPAPERRGLAAALSHDFDFSI